MQKTPFTEPLALGRHRSAGIKDLRHGDLLVRLDSAVGFHKDELRHLQVRPENCQVFHEKNHFDLLYDERVHRQVIEWFRAV